MITLYDFIAMDDTERGETVWEGIHLGERREGDHIIQLYSLPGFYVEVYYDTLNLKIERFRPFTKIHNLAPYIDLGPHHTIDLK